MLRDPLLATLAALVVVSAYLLSNAYPKGPTPAPDQATQAVLARRIPGDVHVCGSLREAVAQLVALGCPIDVHWVRDWPHRERPQRPTIDVRLRDATMQQWLDAVAFQLGIWQTSVWVGTDGRINLSSDRTQQPPVAGRVYDVRDLNEDARLFARLFPRRDAYPVPDPDFPPPPDWIATSDFVEPVLTLAGGNTWGGRNAPRVGSSYAMDGRLFVMHTPEVHRRIEVLLAALRGHRNGPPSPGK